MIMKNRLVNSKSEGEPLARSEGKSTTFSEELWKGFI